MIAVKDFTDLIYNEHGINRSSHNWDNSLNWDKLLLENGYHCVTISNLKKWNSIHTWLHRHINEKEYVWVGMNFYFTHHNDAVLFALKWA